MTLATMLALPLIMLAQGYNLILTQTNGEVITLSSDEIDTMVFAEKEPETPVVTQLETPRLTVASQGDNTIVSWRAVANAASYSYSIDERAAESTTSNQISIPALAPGSHTVSVTAVSGSEEYTDSEPAVISFTIASPISIVTLEMDPKYALAEFKSSEPCDFYVGILLKSNYVNDAEAIKYINANTVEAQRREVKTSGEVYFRQLADDKEYIILAYPKDSKDRADKLEIKTPKSSHIQC